MNILVKCTYIALCFYPCTGIAIDYYWRNYFGVIPDDAVKGGYHETGNVTYIGQILVDHDSVPPAILPAIIYPGQKRAVATNYGNNIYDDKYVKILCSPRKDLMQWRQTTLDKMHLLTDYHIVIGGWDADGDMVVHIGRANVDNQLMIGKVYIKSSQWAGLTLNTKARTGLKLSSFELLVYSRT